MIEPKEQRHTTPYRPWWKVAADFNEQSKLMYGAVTSRRVVNKKYRAVVSAC